MTLTTIGWIVLHSLWQGTLIGGLAALVVALVPDRRAAVRYVVAYGLLWLTLIGPVVATVNGVRSVRAVTMPHLMPLVESSVGFPTLVWWGSVIVPIVGAMWLLGVLLGCLRFVAGIRYVRRVRRLPYVTGHRIRLVTEGLMRQMAIGPRISVGRADVPVPLVVGWRRPLILLPLLAAQRMDTSRLRAVLAHEFAHVQRRDYAANLLQAVADVLLFHHPAARWLSTRIRIEREYCCDDTTIRETGEAREYAHALAELEDARVPSVLVVAAGSGTLLDRIQRIADEPREVLTPARGLLAAATAIIIASVLLAVTLAVPPALPFATVVLRRQPGPRPPSSQLMSNEAPSRPRTR